MQIRGSECLCVAIESHSVPRVRAVLDWPDLVYRDMFLVQQKPLHYKLFNFNFDDEYFQILHETSCPTFNDGERCGHEQVDVELREQLLDDLDRILVSLRQLARWHSNGNFPAEQMLRANSTSPSRTSFTCSGCQRTDNNNRSPTCGGRLRSAPCINR